MHRKNSFLFFPGNLVSPPPSVLTDANMYGFLLPGDPIKLQHFVDETLNKGTNVRHRLWALPLMSVTFTDIHQVRSTNPRLSALGWFQETDIIIWIPVFRLLPYPQIYSFPAFIGVNNPTALVIGREVFGYNKVQIHQTNIPPIGDKPDHLFLDVESFQTFGEDEQMKPYRLFDVTKSAEKPAFPDVSGLNPLLAAGAEMFNSLEDMPSKLGPLLRKLNTPKTFEGDAFSAALPQILLKMMPGLDGYSAIVRKTVVAKAKMLKIKRPPVLYGDAYDFEYTQNAMLPLEQMFGITPGVKHRALMSFNLVFDFYQEAAKELPR